MNVCVATGVSVLSYAFQVAGALILLLWCIGNLDKKVKQNCVDSHAGILWGEFDAGGEYTNLSAADLQASAKNIYLNIVAFGNLVVGYALAIFMTDVAVSPCYILLFVVLAVVAILCIEYFLIAKIAAKKYCEDQKVYDKDLAIKTGTLKFSQESTKKDD